MGMYEFKNTKAPDLSNLISLQSQGASNAFNSLANIGNTIQNIQQKNIDRENRNLLAQGMLQSLKQDPNLINTIQQATDNTNVPLNQVTKLINLGEAQRNNEQKIADQKLQYELSNSFNSQDNNIINQGFENRNTPYPDSIINPVLNKNTGIINAVGNLIDQQKINDATSSSDPVKVQKNLLGLNPYDLYSKEGIKLLSDKQNSTLTEVKNQNQQINDNAIKSNIDVSFNLKNPNYLPILSKGETDQEITNNGINDISQRESVAVKQINESDLNPLLRQRYLQQVAEKSSIAKKTHVESLVKDGILDPSKYPDMFKTLGYTGPQIENLYKNIYNTGNVDFGKGIDLKDPIYSPLRTTQEVLTSYQTANEEDKNTFSGKMKTVYEISKAYEAPTPRDSINLFLGKYNKNGEIVSEGDVQTAVERYKKESNGNLTTAEILGLLDYSAQSEGYLNLGSVEIDKNYWSPTFKDEIGKLTPAKKVEIQKQSALKSQIDTEIKTLKQELINLTKQYKDPTNKLSKDSIKNRIDALAIEIQKRANPNYAQDVLLSKTEGR